MEHYRESFLFRNWCGEGEWVGERPLRLPGMIPKSNTAPPAVAVVARALRLSHGARVAVDGADLAFPEGALTAIVGPNGSGKSTLLRAVSGLHPVADGDLRVLGSTAVSARRRVAHVLQATVTNDAVPITVEEVVRMGRYGRARLFGRIERDVVGRAMERMGVADLANRHLTELSGGQRQRVLIAQALVQDAELLLLDEPIAGLDVASADRIDALVREEVDAGRTVVLTTHDLHTAMKADHVVLLSTRVVAQGRPEEVLTTDHLSDAYGGHLHELPGGGFVLDDPHPH